MRPDFASSWPGSYVLLVMVAGALPVGAPAQCSNPWLATSSTPGVLGGARMVNAAALWDRDGGGPLPAVVVVGGDFTIAGSVTANHIAAFDPATNTWSALGFGLGGPVLALQPMPNGDLIAGGSFTTAGGVATSNIARWNGATWASLGGGIAGSDVRALAILPNGDLVAGGLFNSNIARWNGATWAPLGAGIAGSDVRALAILPNGNLVAGGQFTAAGGGAASNIARWDGASWTPLGLGLDGAVRVLLTLSNGDLVAGGDFFYSGTGGPLLNRVARWNGTAWSPVGSGVFGGAGALAELANGNLVVGSSTTQSHTSCLLWNGLAWSQMGAPGDDFGTVRAFTTLPNGDLVAGGNFFRLGGIGASSVGLWNGTVWSAMGSGLTSALGQLAELADGTVVGIGNFAVGPSRNIGLWNGATWVPFPVGLQGVSRILPLANGNLLAAGAFAAGGGVVNNLALWNGTSLSTYAPGLATQVSDIADIAVLPNGDVAACGTFAPGLAVWNGATWTTPGMLIAPTGFLASGAALAVTATGELVVGGRFTGVGGVAANNIARWNGTVWSPLGPGLAGIPWSAVTALRELPNGDLVASGFFAGLIARWNGTAWSTLGTGISFAANVLACLPNGDLVAGGRFTVAGGVTVNRIARWNGVSWSAFDAGTDNQVNALAVRANGDLLVGGDFHTVNGSLTPFFAQITTTCPATAVVSGSGCTGSGGPNVLTAATLPWLGSTFRARATGLPPMSFALIASGLTPIALPLSALLPQGLPGCTAWVLGDVLDVALPTAGAVQTQVAVPNSAGLVGATFHQQVLPFVFDLSGNLIELTSTNALTLTLGAF